MKKTLLILAGLILAYSACHSQDGVLPYANDAVVNLSPEISLDLVNDQMFIYPDNPQFNFHADYAQKAKSQRTIAWILAGAGAGLIITGIAVGGSDKNDVGDAINDTFEGAWLIAGGAVLAVASIPMFIISGKNRQKAGVSANFSINSLPSYTSSTPSALATMGLTLNLK